MNEQQENTKPSIFITDIINVFIEIDTEIAKLHEYSEKDFKTFNDVMKKSHENANQISKYANNIIEFSRIEYNKNLIQKLKAKYEILGKNCFELKEKLKTQNFIFSEFHDRLRYLNLIIKNLRQNFFTLKYISANLKLETYDLNHEPNFKFVIEKIEKDIKQTTDLIKKIDVNFIYLQKHLEEQISIESGGIFETFEIISTNLERLKGTIELIEKEYLESEKYYPRIKDKIKEASESINKIVIKLQYQDIIRQKMNHMQVIYKKIINYFNTISKNAEDNENRVLQYYSKIEYIASLQVAQLIQTNREYEEAIESISEQLLQVTLNVNDISYYLKIFTNEIPQQEEAFINWTKKYLEQIKSGILKIQKSKLLFSADVDKLKNLFNEFKDLNLEIENQSIATATYILSIKIDENKSLSKTLNFRKLHEISQNVLKISENFKKAFLKINPQIWEISNFSGSIFDFNPENLNKIEDKIQKVENNENAMQEILKKSIELTKRISAQVIDSIQGVSYYDIFEKSVERIISKLNFLNENLKFNKTELTQEDIENLKDFENIYTIKTEKEIHQLIIENQSFDVSQIRNEEDSDVEFF